MANTKGPRYINWNSILDGASNETLVELWQDVLARPTAFKTAMADWFAEQIDAKITEGPRAAGVPHVEIDPKVAKIVRDLYSAGERIEIRIPGNKKRHTTERKVEGLSIKRSTLDFQIAKLANSPVELETFQRQVEAILRSSGDFVAGFAQGVSGKVSVFIGEATSARARTKSPNR